MKIERIDALLRTMPEASKIYTNMGSGANSGVAHAVFENRVACARNDPAFPWMYVRAFISMKLPFPAEVKEHYMREAYIYESVDTPEVGRLYQHICEAKLYRHPTWSFREYFLRALLLRPELTMQEIALKAKVSLKVLTTYENLFFNVRDRLNDDVYVSSLRFPETRHVEYQSDYWLTEHPGRLMLRSKTVDEVLSLYGIDFQSSELPSLDVLKSNVRYHVLKDANIVLNTGGGNQSGIKSVQTAKTWLNSEEMSGQKKDTTDGMAGLQALSIGYAVIETVKGVCCDTSDLKRQMEEDDAPFRTTINVASETVKKN
jgi:hypothetical protein